MAEIFTGFPGLNKLLYKLCVHLVQNLEIILWNVSSTYKILVKCLDSWLARALKVTIFQGLLLLRRAKRASKLSGMKIRTMNFQLLKGIIFPTFTSWDIHIWTLVMFVCADQFLEIFLDLQFLLCISTRNIPICTVSLATLFLKRFP